MRAEELAGEPTRYRVDVPASIRVVARWRVLRERQRDVHIPNDLRRPRLLAGGHGHRLLAVEDFGDVVE
jgi:hypothetical protein